MTTIKKLHIDIIADIACPWCYIGMHRLERAIANVRDTIEVTHRWVPFELFPALPAHGMERTRHMISLFGSRSKMKSVFDHVQEVGRNEGIELNFDRITVSINTFDLHRLIWKAAHYQNQHEVAKAFFTAFFTEGINLAERESIVAVMTRVGWTPQQTHQFLNSNEGAAEVISERQLNMSRGVTAVPHYIINHHYSITGAQPINVFEELLIKASASQHQLHSTTLQ